MATVEDLVTGAGFLPHVYCKKVILENSSAEGDNDSNLVDVTLQLEVYQKVSNLTESNWLNNLSVLGKNIMDSMYIQVIPFTSTANIAKLKPSTKPASVSYAQSIYSADLYFGDGYLPRIKGATIGGITGNIAENFVYLSKDDITSTQFKRYQLSNSSLLGNISSADAIADGVANGQIREEIKYGEAYYVIPFTSKHQFDPTLFSNLGFLFYTLLDVREFMIDTGIADSATFDVDEILESAIIEGPINTEVVYENSKVAMTREVFVLPDGRVWEGSVHLHATGINPDQSGYSGDGSFGENKGWMAGQMHQPGANQPRLSLVLASNNKLQNFISSTQGTLADGVLGLGQETPIKAANAIQDGAITDFLSPFDKLSKKYISKFGIISDDLQGLQAAASSAKYYDNDSEYSKLYISRDAANNARGIFFINMIQFAYNNSKLFPVLYNAIAGPQATDKSRNEAAARRAEIIGNIFNKSKILELKLKRRRVQRDIIGNRPETFANDTLYEEAPATVGRIYDSNKYGSPSQTTGISEIDMGQQYIQRYFTFTDFEVGDYSAGLYEYSIDIDFYDGSYDYVRELMIDLINAKKNMDLYYELSTQTYVKDAPGSPSIVKDYTGNPRASIMLVPYYQNGAFNSKFYEEGGAVKKVFGNDQPWNVILTQLQRLQDMFNIVNAQGQRFNLQDLFPLVDPQSGSPEGISAIINIANSALTTLQSILSVQKTLTSSGNDLTKNSYANQQSLNDLGIPVTSPAISVISDSHAFYNMFEATSVDKTYIDYLSINKQSQRYLYNGIRRLNKETFSTRAQLDVAKFTPEARNNNFNSDISNSSNFPIGTYATTAYTFLTPSIIQLDAGADVHTYSSFSPNAVSYLSSGDTADAPNPTDLLYSDTFFDYALNNQIYTGMLNYNLNYKNTRDFDFTSQTEVPVLNSSLSQQGNKYKFLEENVNENQMKMRESYKNLFENVGLQLHTRANARTLYGENFVKQPGVRKAAEPVAYPLIVEEQFSDATAKTHDVFEKILNDERQTLIETPDLKKLKQSTDFSAQAVEALGEADLGASQYAPFIINAPIAFKLAKGVMGNRSVQPQMNILYEVYDAILEAGPVNSLTNLNLPIILFNFAMYMRIEVYNPPQGFLRPGVAKDDVYNWRPITEQDIKNLSDRKKIFCRMMPAYNDALNDIFLPYIDRYFILDIDAASSSALDALSALTRVQDYGTFDDISPQPVVTSTPAATKQLGSIDWEKQDNKKPLGQQAAAVGVASQPAASTTPSTSLEPQIVINAPSPAIIAAAVGFTTSPDETTGNGGGY